MRGLMTRQPDGTLAATLKDAWGYTFVLTGTRAEGGYDVEVRLTGVPETLALPGDDQWFEVTP